MTHIYRTPVDVNAGYLDVRKGDTYCHSVVRSFRARKLLVTDERVPVEELLRICPVPAVQVKAALAAGKTFTNIFTDAWKGEDTSREKWTWGTPHANDWETKEAAALDPGWYRGHTYAEWQEWYDKTFRLKTV